MSSLLHDRTVKVPLYARHDVPEVWILDVQHRDLHFFHTVEAGHYTHSSSTAAPGLISLHALPGAKPDLTGLFETDLIFESISAEAIWTTLSDLSGIKAQLPYLAAKSDVSDMKASMIQWMVGTMITVTALAFTIAKLIH
ncbi:MAG TPA: Uma2 family endonuclease [Steroidobacteraceae bacterium]